MRSGFNFVINKESRNINLEHAVSDTGQIMSQAKKTARHFLVGLIEKLFEISAMPSTL